MLAAIA
jgi:hypothetical protein